MYAAIPRSPEHCVRSIDELRHLERLLRSRMRLDPASTFAFALPGLTAHENAQLASSMGNYHRECGCFAGGLLMGSSVLLLLARALLAEGGWPGLTPRTVLLNVGIVLGSALAGKLAGLLWARIQMVRLAGRALLVAQGRLDRT